jgi:hypothetical protein
MVTWRRTAYATSSPFLVGSGLSLSDRPNVRQVARDPTGRAPYVRPPLRRRPLPACRPRPRRCPRRLTAPLCRHPSSLRRPPLSTPMTNPPKAPLNPNSDPWRRHHHRRSSTTSRRRSYSETNCVSWSNRESRSRTGNHCLMGQAMGEVVQRAIDFLIFVTFSFSILGLGLQVSRSTTELGGKISGV